jgi:hypothetical protein
MRHLHLYNFLVLPLIAGVLTQGSFAQQAAGTYAQPSSNSELVAALPDAPSVALPDQPTQPDQTAAAQSSGQTTGYEGKQTKRILGIVPNFRSVSVDEKLPPLSPRDKLKLMTEDSFDYSSFIYVGILAGIAQGEGSYPEFHSGAPAYARYYWHSFTDTLDGNLMTEFLVPVATKEDPRYYTQGHGSFLKRTGYSVSRLFVTRTDSGGPAPNFSEIVGNGAAAGVSNFYYPSEERTWTKTGQRWVTQVGLDGASNLIKEFWPDVNSWLFHNKY